MVCIDDTVEVAAAWKGVVKMKIEAPSMPCITADPQTERQEKLPSIPLPFPAAVSRPVSRKEMLENPEALKR